MQSKTVETVTLRTWYDRSAAESRIVPRTSILHDVRYQLAHKSVEGQPEQLELRFTFFYFIDDNSFSSSSSNDSSNDDSELNSNERCPICLKRFKDQDVGTPESCDHTFCLECLEEWSKYVTTCPVDRSPYKLILAKHAPDLAIFKRIEVVEKGADSTFASTASAYSETFCEVCGRSDNEHHLLLCDNCDAGYHCECLDPPLSEVPEDEWYCPQCLYERNLENERSDEESVTNVGTSITSTISPTINRVRIPRTNMVERVRHAVNQRRNITPITEETQNHAEREEEDSGNEVLPNLANVFHGTSKTTQANTKKVTRTRKTRVKSKIRRNKIVMRRRNKKRRNRTKKKAKYNHRTLASSSTRAATSSLVLPSSVSSRCVSSLTSLSIYGNTNDIDYCAEDADIPGTSKIAKISTFRAGKEVPTPDILNRILESQRLLYSKSSITNLKRDGDMELKKCDIALSPKKNSEVESKRDEEMKEYDPFDMAQYSESDIEECQDTDMSSGNALSSAVSFDVSDIPLPCGSPPLDIPERKNVPLKLTFNKSNALKNLMTSYQSTKCELSSSSENEDTQTNKRESVLSLNEDENAMSVSDALENEQSEKNDNETTMSASPQALPNDVQEKKHEKGIDEEKASKKDYASDSSSYQYVEATSLEEEHKRINCDEQSESEYEEVVEKNLSMADSSSSESFYERSNESLSISGKSDIDTSNEHAGDVVKVKRPHQKKKRKGKSESRSRQKPREFRKLYKKRERHSSESEEASTSRNRRYRRSPSVRSYTSSSLSTRSSSDTSVHKRQSRSRTRHRKHEDINSDEQRHSKRTSHRSYDKNDSKLNKVREQSPRKKSKETHTTRHHRNDFDDLRRSGHTPPRQQRHWNQHEDQRRRRYINQENVVPSVSNANVALRYYIPQPQYYTAPPARIVSPRWYQHNSMIHEHFETNGKRSHSGSKQIEGCVRNKKEERQSRKKSSSKEKRRRRKGHSESINKGSNYSRSSSSSGSSTSSSSTDLKKMKKRKRMNETDNEKHVQNTQEELSLEDKQKIFRRLTSVASGTLHNRNTTSDGNLHSKRSNLIEIVPVENVTKQNDLLSNLNVDDQKSIKENITADFSEYIVEEMLQEEEKGENKVSDLNEKPMMNTKEIDEMTSAEVRNGEHSSDRSSTHKPKIPSILFKLSTCSTSISNAGVTDLNSSCRSTLIFILDLIELICEICENTHTYRNDITSYYTINNPNSGKCDYDNVKASGNVKNEIRFDWNIENLKKEEEHTAKPKFSLYEAADNEHITQKTTTNDIMNNTEVNVDVEQETDAGACKSVDYWSDIIRKDQPKNNDFTDVFGKEKNTDSKFNTRMINAWLSSTTPDHSLPIPGIHERSLDKRISLLLDEPIKTQPEVQKVGSWLQSTAKPKQPSDIDNFIEQIFKPRHSERSVLNKSVDEILKEASEPYDPESEDPLLEIAPTVTSTAQVAESPVQTLVKLTETLSKFINSSKIPAEVMAKEREKMPPPPPPPPPMCTAVPEETAEDLERLIRNKEIPSSAKQMERMERYVQKVKRLEEIVACAKECIKPRYIHKDINKVQYKVVMKKTVDKMMRTKGPVDKQKINELINYYIDKRQFK